MLWLIARSDTICVMSRVQALYPVDNAVDYPNTYPRDSNYHDKPPSPKQRVVHRLFMSLFSFQTNSLKAEIGSWYTHQSKPLTRRMNAANTPTPS